MKSTRSRRRSPSTTPSPRAKNQSGLAIKSEKQLSLFRLRKQDYWLSAILTARQGVIATPAIGQGPDGVAFDDGYACQCKWQRRQTITMAGETSPGKFEPVATIMTQNSARTVGSDQKAHKLYLPAAEFGPPPAPPAGGGKAGRAQAIADSFMIIVVGRGSRHRRRLRVGALC